MKDFAEIVLIFFIGVFIVHIIFLFYKKWTRNKVSKYNLILNSKIKFIGVLAIYMCGGSISIIRHFQSEINHPPTLQEDIGIMGMLISLILLIPFLFNCLTSLMSSLDEE